VAIGLQPHSKVPAPVLIPTRYGLYAAATVIDEPHGMWEYGTVWDDSDNCTHGGLWQPCCNEFAGLPSVTCRPVGVTVTLTATPQEGGGAQITVVAVDDWTGPTVSVLVSVTGLPATAIASDGVPVVLGVVGACDASYAISASTVGPPPSSDSGTLVVDVDCNGTARLLLEVCLPEPIDNKAFSTSTFVFADPFVVYDGRICPNFTEDQLRASAVNRLGASEQRQVEQQFWIGPTRMHLAGPDTVVLGGGLPVSPAMGIALLEGYLADHYLGVGYIHAPRYTAGLLHREMQVVYDLATGATLATAIGSRYVFGTGYPTTGPDGTPAPPGHAWLYATGQVVVRRSPLVVNATRDRLTGCITALAERTVVVAAQCGFVAGVLIDFDRCDCPEPTP
jgi:hypothetical protein